MIVTPRRRARFSGQEFASLVSILQAMRPSRIARLTETKFRTGPAVRHHNHPQWGSSSDFLKMISIRTSHSLSGLFVSLVDKNVDANIMDAKLVFSLPVAPYQRSDEKQDAANNSYGKLRCHLLPYKSRCPKMHLYPSFSSTRRNGFLAPACIIEYGLRDPASNSVVDVLHGPSPESFVTIGSIGMHPFISTAADSLNLHFPTTQLVAQLLNWGLFGVLTVQLYIYYVAFPRDPRHRKGMVYLVYILEIVQVILTTRDAFLTYASQWGDVAHADEVKMLWFSIPVMCGLIGGIVQMFYAWRILLLSKNRVSSGTIALTSLLAISFSIWDGIDTRNAERLTAVSRAKTFYTGVLWLGMTALCDLVITCSMSYYLYKAKNLSTVERTSVLLTRLIKLTVETGFITAACAILELVLFVASRDTLVYAVFMGISGKLYSNCFMAILNSRIQITDGRITDRERVMPISNFVAASPSIRNWTVVEERSAALGGFTVGITKGTDGTPEAIKASDGLDLRWR
ncbi:hypothetical protein EIP91_011193 [Steccherinum ochraceum]|uniref:DUF6534 domain-containing protein n=1 Tax=Steccherinum ochraceum TaxID=92696 RepID=A0A4V2MUV0_9APHY|nr:hypothetical protein EIP91_011193 [Steccherinum ochraceum]